VPFRYNITVRVVVVIIIIIIILLNYTRGREILSTLLAKAVFSRLLFRKRLRGVRLRDKRSGCNARGAAYAINTNTIYTRGGDCLNAG
jgi:hypothetical protein